jgi:hypothetical protein
MASPWVSCRPNAVDNLRGIDRSLLPFSRYAEAVKGARNEL